MAGRGKTLTDKRLNTTVRLHPDVLRQVDFAAAAAGMTRSAYIERLLSGVVPSAALPLYGAAVAQ